MKTNTIKNLIKKVLQSDERLWNEEKTEFNQNLLIDLLEHIDEKIIHLFLEESELREKFFTKNKSLGVFVFKSKEFQFFLEENKIDNSYTQYKNRIGLTDSKKFLKDTNDVVLDFPYKDCVLEGGQSSEEGSDTYFEYDESVTKTEEKKGWKAGEYNEKKAKRKEVFFNQVLAHDEIDRLLDHKALVGWKRHTVNGEEKVTEIKRNKEGVITENFIIKGNNLIALHSLKKQFAGKIKLIYIDPPYNTGNDGFKYNDNFNHSTWLTFMKNRLEVARELLSDDGSIFISIDDDESHYLKILCDDIFGRKNFIANVIWQKKYSPQNDAKWLSDTHDHILVIAKNKEVWRPNLLPRTDEMNSRYKNPDNDSRGNWKSSDMSVKTYSKAYDFEIKTPSGRIVNPPNGRCWRFGKEKFEEMKKDNRVWFGDAGENVPSIKRFLSEVQDGLVSKTLWLRDEVGDNQEAKKETNNLGFAGAGFETPKPEKLMQRIIELGTKPNDIVLDFFSGSGTTAAVAHKMGRQYIAVEQMDYIHDLPESRLMKVIEGEQGGISKSVDWKGGGEFIYCELAKWNEIAKKRINAFETFEELLGFYDEMYDKYFIDYNLKIKEFKEKVIKEENFINLSLDEQKKIFLKMLDLNQMYVCKTERADSKFGISKEDQDLTEEFYDEGQ